MAVQLHSVETPPVMLHSLAKLLLVFAHLAIAAAASSDNPVFSRTAPIVHTQRQGTFKGLYNASSNVEAFYGVPFAQPPIGHLRFQRTKSLEPYNVHGVRDATTVSQACLQSSIPTFGDVTSEDIHRPEGTKEGDDLPVLLWIHGGAWTTGSTQTWGYPSTLVQHSVRLGKPVIHVAGAYRLGAFGFLGGADVAHNKHSSTSNAGYYDQRETMRWVQENIRAFGGDPSMVTVFGQSAGAQSVGVHLLTNGGDNEGLFRAAILQSGAPATAARYTATDERPQQAYNDLLEQTNCSDVPCLRQVPAGTLRDISAAINMQTYVYGYPSWFPLIDGYFISDVPSRLYAKGAIADVPVIVGTVQDEGTIFADWARNVTTEKDLTQGILTSLGNSTQPLAPTLLNEIWPNNDMAGSPFRPEFFGVASDDRYFGPRSDFKRAAAIFGDWVIDAPVRSFLNATYHLHRYRKSKTWGYLFAQPTTDFYALDKPYKGVPHGSEIAYVYHYPASASNFTTDSAEERYCNSEQIQHVTNFMSEAWINFATHLDPNGQEGTSARHRSHGHAHPHWPAHHHQEEILYIQGGNITAIPGAYRKKQVEFFLRHKDVYRF